MGISLASERVRNRGGGLQSPTTMPENNKEEPQTATPFGDTELGQMLGCGWIILCVGASVVGIVWAVWR